MLLAIAAATFAIFVALKPAPAGPANPTGLDRLVPASAGGTITAASPVVELGSVSARELAGRQQPFTFRNSSDKPWRLVDAKTSCGCMALDFPRTEVAPGQSVTVAMRIDWADRLGPQAGTLTVSNSAGDKLTVGVRGTVVQQALVTPPDMVITAEGTRTRTRTRPFELLAEGAGAQLLEIRDVPPGVTIVDRTGNPLTLPAP